jgi:uncharacterized membrane protein
MKSFISDLSGKEYPNTERVSGKSVRTSLLKLIQHDFPKFTNTQHLSITELNQYRQKYISDYLLSEIGELSDLEKTVLTTLKDRTTLTTKIEEEEFGKMTTGQRVADNVAEFGGSWTFIIAFGCFMLLWILANVVWLANRGFDPFPFILLNLVLSCLAAMQAPVIMMSQNRQEEKDRFRAKKDYMINLKSELEIRLLHEKLDHLIMHQQQELIEIQKIQIEMMKDILNQIKSHQ